MAENNKNLPLPNDIKEVKEKASEIKKDAVKKPIRVQAIRQGMWKRMRMSPGDIFTIDEEKQLGSWMKKID